jgi:drug/metabolite transporter (DMT)-like permease
MSRGIATAIGFAAVVMWSALALLSAASGEVPPFQLAAMTFLVGGLLGAASWPFRPHAIEALKQDWRVWVLGVAGLYGYHFVYFSAIRAAPPVEVSLIAYLWPLFLVVFAGLLPGERIRRHHIAGVLFGIAGAFLLITRGGELSFRPEHLKGHILAFFCALIWSGYSVLSRRLAKVPTDVVTGYCLATAALAALSHLVFETSLWPETAALYAWDFGVKRGDIMVLGALSYASPLLSVLLLVAAGFAAFSWSVATACFLIVVGALLAAKDMLVRPV